MGVHITRCHESTVSFQTGAALDPIGHCVAKHNCVHNAPPSLEMINRAHYQVYNLLFGITHLQLSIVIENADENLTELLTHSGDWSSPVPHVELIQRYGAQLKLHPTLSRVECAPQLCSICECCCAAKVLFGALSTLVPRVPCNAGHHRHGLQRIRRVSAGFSWNKNSRPTTVRDVVEIDVQCYGVALCQPRPGVLSAQSCHHASICARQRHFHSTRSAPSRKESLTAHPSCASGAGQISELFGQSM